MPTAARIIAGALDAPEGALKNLERGHAWLAYQQGGVRASAVTIAIPKAQLPHRISHIEYQITDHRYAIPRADAMIDAA